ncbi:MAG: hypothetical protein OXF79_16050 [Chloroflexi bacterium]|nr:hypothetical protein [Chloroflexota bacterium]
MDGLALVVLKYVPRYVSDFGRLLIEPKRFLSQECAKPNNSFQYALAFFALSTTVQVILLLASASRVDAVGMVTPYTLRFAIASFVALILFALNVHWAWRLVGGTAKIRDTFVVGSYLCGAVNVIATFVLLLGMGVAIAFDSPSYECVRSNSENSSVCSKADVRAILAVLSIYIVGALAILVWFLSLWGIYRILNNSTKLRSFFAYCIGAVSSIVPSAILFFLFYDVAL